MAILRLFYVAQENGLDIHPATLRLITQNIRLVDRLRADPEANRLFMEMMTSRHDPETTLRRLNEAGVFGRFIPDFGRVVAQTQHDMYHTYTVDEHTIRAIGILARIESGELKEDHPLSADVVHKILSRPVLYLAVLLHDIAKGRGGDHSALGADVALQIGPRLGLSAAETETVAWLVRYHLAMSGTAFQRDLMDPKTIESFAGLVQSPERLRLLLVLTVCDIRAVGPNVWNGWKAALLRQLYSAAEQVLSGGTLAGGRAERIKQVQADVAERLTGWSDAEKDEHFARGYAPYWLSFDADSLARQAGLVRDRATLREFIFLSVLPALRQVELPLSAHAYAALNPTAPDWNRVGELCGLAHALKSAREARLATENIGRQRAELTASLHSHPLARDYLARAAESAWPECNDRTGCSRATYKTIIYCLAISQ